MDSNKYSGNLPTYEYNAKQGTNIKYDFNV